MVPMVMHPVSKYRAAVGVELGTQNILFSIDLSNISSSSSSCFVSLYQTSELVSTELMNMIYLKIRAILK